MGRSVTWQKKLAQKEKARAMRERLGNQGSRRLSSFNGDVNTGTPHEEELAARREKSYAQRCKRAEAEGKPVPARTIPRSDIWLDCRADYETTKPLPRLMAERCAVVASNTVPRNRRQRRLAKFGLSQAGWV